VFHSFATQTSKAESPVSFTKCDYKLTQTCAVLLPKNEIFTDGFFHMSDRMPPSDNSKNDRKCFKMAAKSKMASKTYKFTFKHQQINVNLYVLEAILDLAAILKHFRSFFELSLGGIRSDIWKNPSVNISFLGRRTAQVWVSL
jgi:hypothetical protein